MIEDQGDFVLEWISGARMAREDIRRAYAELFQEASQALFRADPIGINLGDNTDEYDPEVGTILPRLMEAQSEVELQKIIHEEFVRWFGEDTAGLIDHYQESARLIWNLRSKYADELGLGFNK